MKLVESLFEKSLSLIFETLCGLQQNPYDHELGKFIQENLRAFAEKYHRNMLVDLLKKKLFDLGVYQQDFSPKLFVVKKRQVEKLIETFKNDGIDGIISSFVSQLYIQLDGNEFSELIRNAVKFLNTSIYDGNEQAQMVKKINKVVRLEIYEDEEDDQVIFSKVLQRKRLEKDSIIIDDVNKVVYWSKESFESLIQNVKHYQKNDSLDILIELIGKVREVQTQQIIQVNCINQEDLHLLPLHLRTKFEKMKLENESVRNLISQGFNTNSFHFILEFIQNADDSEYLEDGILEFDFDSKKKLLSIRSNESGFTFDNMFAITSLANSDKVSKKLETPAIGEKGIGFKTVFSVCDQVHLVSNGFDVQLTSLDLTEKKEGKGFHLTEGTLYEMNIEKFEHTIFEKYTLLTLKNIKTIIFKDNENITTYSLTIDKNNEYTLTTSTKKKLKTKTDKETFYSFSKKIDMKGVLCEKRPNFHEANLMIFYPAVWSDERFKLHSFLPVKEDYNLPLLVQSDFILSQNREALVDDSDWNITIINKLPQLIMESFDTMKEIKGWKYNFFRMLSVEPKLHFTGIQHKTIDLLKDVKCISVIDDMGKTFEKPSNVILMNGSPINPYQVFGVKNCTTILSKYCIDPMIEKENFLKHILVMESLSGTHIELLAKELPYQIKLVNIVPLYQLFKQFLINIDKFDFEIVPTELEKLVKPSESLFDEYFFSKGGLIILEKVGCHCISSKIDFYKKNIKRRRGDFNTLSYEERFILGAEEPNFFNVNYCLTTDNKWVSPQKNSDRYYYFETEYTQYLKNIKFVDTRAMLTILRNHNSLVNSHTKLTQVLKDIGIRSIPVFFKLQSNLYIETEEFVQLRAVYPTLESLILYFDTNWELFYDQIEGIQQFLNRNIQNFYHASLRDEFGDSVEYIPNIRTNKLENCLKAKKEDFYAYQCLLRKSKNASSTLKGLKSKFSQNIIRLLKDEPLLETTDGQYVVLSQNLFQFGSLDRIRKYRPEWNEIGASYRFPEITNHLRTLSDTDYLIVLNDANPSLEDQQYFIVTLLKMQKSINLSNIHVTIDGKKRKLSTMYWDIPTRDVFPISVNERILAPHFNSNEIKTVLETNNPINRFSELCNLFNNQFEKIMKNDISKLDEKEIVQFEALISSGFDFYLSDPLVWHLQELQDIPYFQSLDLSRKFGKSSSLVMKHDKKANGRLVSESKVKEFLGMKGITDDQFFKVWTYAKRNYKQRVFSFICDNGLIVHHNEKHKPHDLFRATSPEILEHLPHLKSLQVDDRYKEFGISQDIPVHILCKEIEKLEGCINGAEEKCLIIYKEIDQLIKSGKIKNIGQYKKFRILRNDKGIHFSGKSKIYFCDNEETFKPLSSVVNCLFVRNVTTISHFLQAFDIHPLSRRVSFKGTNFEPSETYFDELLEKTNTLIQTINKYLANKNFKTKQIKVQIVKSISVTARVDNIPACTINPTIHSDVDDQIIYIHETVFQQDIFKEKQFILAILHFYPQLEGPIQDFLKLLIVSHSGPQEYIAVVSSLIFPKD